MPFALGVRALSGSGFSPGCAIADHLEGNCGLGPLAATALRDQFERIRTGDRFFWTRDEDLKTSTVRRIINLYGVRLSEVIKWNTGIRNIPRDAFHTPLSWHGPYAHTRSPSPG